MKDKIWDGIKPKWASLSGAKIYTEFLNDATYAKAEELDDTLKVYRYNGSEAGIRCDAIVGKDIVMNGDAYIYNCTLYLTGDIYKGTFNASSSARTHKKINDYFVLKVLRQLTVQI